jgi:FkbH-like protein
MIDFKTLKSQAKTVGKAASKSARLAVLGNYSTQFLTMALDYSGLIAGIGFETYEAGYDQAEAEVYDPDSALYRHDPDFILITLSTLKLQTRFYALPEEKRISFTDDLIGELRGLLTTLRSRSRARIILNNLEIINDQIFGSLYAKVDRSFAAKPYELNGELLGLIKTMDDCYLFDLNGLVQYYGAVNVRDWAQYVNADLHFSLDFHATFAKHLTAFIAAFLGAVKKCLIFDLDNTIWGGVIGDDGIGGIEIGSLGTGKSYTELQQWFKQLKERGILLAVCSKNDEAIAKEPFEQHPEMILRLTDIAVFIANWENKADNIRTIQQILNIGFDSMVFIDDHPAERFIVRQQLPEVCVPELPEDPAQYLDLLKSLHLFETASLMSGDKDRTLQYQQEAQRKQLQFAITDIGDYLKSLGMRASIGPFETEDIPRIAQLSQRSNQFNLRTTRYSETEIRRVISSPDYFTIAVKLRDRFGDYGLISTLILKKMDKRSVFIDTWIMSCRVLKRGVECVTLNYCVALCAEAGYDLLVGEYIATARNGLVKDHYRDLGFSSKEGRWFLNTKEYSPCSHHLNG